MSKRAVLKWMKKLHTYAGLLTFTAFVVWGVIGVAGAFAPGPGNYQPPDISSVQDTPLTAPANLDDKALARYVFDNIYIPLRGGHYNIRRDESGNLAFYVFTASGRRDVTYLEDQGISRMEIRQNSIIGFLSTMHTAFSRRGPTTRAARLWGFYNEFAAWAFFFMTVSGIYLWLDTRPGMRWAQLIAASSLGFSVVLWLATR
ncbi:MAG: PepSY domain-containing protein [Acidobacteria bacterium]|nr:PepSY domain-containing protein [Acidobacteriota bacterium]MDA1234078.1 PepSY domain-containing protein [Acidobacteriota bacterium]